MRFGNDCRPLSQRASIGSRREPTTLIHLAGDGVAMVRSSLRDEMVWRDGSAAADGLKPTATFGPPRRTLRPRTSTNESHTNPRSRCHLRFSPEGASLCQPRPSAWVANPQRSDSPNGAALNWTNTKHVIDDDER